MRIRNTHQIPSLEITSIAKGAGIIFVGMIIGTGLRYFFELIVARKLGAELFGLFFLGLAILKITELISTLGLHRGAVRYVALFMGEQDKERTKGTIILALKTVIIVGLVFSLLTIFLSKFIAINIFHNANLTHVIILFSIAIPFTAVTVIITFSTVGFKTMKYLVYIRELFEPSLRILIITIMFTLGWKLFGALFAFVTSLIMGTFLAFYYLKRIFPELISTKVKPLFEYRKILGFSWPALLAELLGLIIIWINILMLGYFETSQEVGIYGAAHRTALLVQIFLLAFNFVFLPVIVDLYNKKEFKKLEKLFKMITKWILLLSFPITLLMIFHASEILNLFGENFRQGAMCLVLLSLMGLVNSVGGSSGSLIMMSGRSRINLLNSIITVSLNICLNLLFIPKFGIVGAAVSSLISITIVNVIMLIEVISIFKFHPFREDLYKPVLAGGISLLILNMLTRYLFQFNTIPFANLLISAFSFLAVYALTIYTLGLGEEDKIILQKVKEKIKA